MDRRGTPWNWRRAGLLLGLTLAVSGCAQFDVADIKLPRFDSNVVALTRPSIYDNKKGARPLGPEDFVDAQGQCPGAATSAVDASLEPALGEERPLTRGVALGMSECEVARSLGQAQNLDIATNERGERTVVMTYSVGERAGTYRFVAGRLVVVERGPEPPADKKPVRGKPPKRAPSA